MQANPQDKSGNDLSVAVSETERPGLFSLSFFALMVTQFLGAFNDNMFRWLLIPIGSYALASQMGGLEEAQKWSLSIGGLVFLLPFVIMVGPAGYFSDRFRKSSVIRVTKIAEIVIMSVGAIGLYFGYLPILFVVLFFMGSQSTIFSPAKYGGIPEIVRKNQIPAANGWVSMSTMAAVILGTLAGGFLFQMTSVIEETATGERYCVAPGQTNCWISAVALISVAIVGWLSSLFIRPTEQRTEDVRFPFNPVTSIFSNIRFLFSFQSIFFVTLGSAFYWGIACLAQTNIDKFIFPEFFQMDDRLPLAICLGMLTLGIALGACLAGLVSRGKISMTIPAYATIGMCAACLVLAFAPGKAESGFYIATGALFLLGLCAGMFDIPLMSFIQDRAPEEQRGRIIASSNLVSNTAMLAAPGIFFLMTANQYGALTARDVWFWVAMSIIPVSLIFFFFAYLRFTAWIVVKGFFRIFYRVEMVGLENVPKDRPVIYISNHISYLDGLLMLVFCPGLPRVAIWSAFVQHPFMAELCRLYHGIPISRGREGLRAIRQMREELLAGNDCGIFPEGAIARWGVIQPFQPGVMKALKGTNAVVVPIFMGGIWGSIFSYFGQKFLWKVPSFSRRRVTIVIGEPLENPKNRLELYQAVKRLECDYYMREHDRIVSRFKKPSTQSSQQNKAIHDSGTTVFADLP